jgi:hypothetical protein
MLFSITKLFGKKDMPTERRGGVGSILLRMREVLDSYPGFSDISMVLLGL